MPELLAAALPVTLPAALPAADAVALHEQLRSVIESARDYAVITIDPGGRIVGWSAGAAAAFGHAEAGLSTSRRFCRMMGGDVTVASEPGVGSTFTVRRPAVTTAPAADGGPAPPGE